MVAKAVEKTVGREVDVALGIPRRDPADRAWAYDRVEGIVDEYLRLGLDGIFLRPLSPYGFAIKTKQFSKYDASTWLSFYERGLRYIKQFTPGKTAQRVGPNGEAMDMEGHYYYGNYYAVQAMFLAGGDYWSNWYPAIRDQLIARQNQQGGQWSGDFSEDYATSMALIILQMPNRYLPVYTGKGPGS